ncbi:MBL fold metallo-hydrolase [Nanoarchaeota archaeon]
MTQTKIKFWGTRGSVPTPGHEYARYGGETSCVEVNTSEKEILILDIGTGGRKLGGSLIGRNDGNNAGIEGKIFNTHYHNDHIQGLGFHGPTYSSANNFTFYGPGESDEDVREIMEGNMGPPYFPVAFQDCAGIKEVKSVKDGDKVETESAYVDVIKGQHPNGVVYYKITDKNTDAKIFYGTDYERNVDPEVDKKFDEEINGVDLLIYDTQYTEKDFIEGWGHGKIEEAVDVAINANVKGLILFHHDPKRTDSDMDELLHYAKGLADEKMEKLGQRPQDFHVYAASDGLAMVYNPDIKRFELMQNGL